MQCDISELVPSSSASVEGVAICGKHFTHQKQAGTMIELNMVCPSYFIIHSPRKCDTQMYIKLEWLVHRTSSFTVRAHATLRRIQNLNALSIVFYHLQSVHTPHFDVYATTTKCGAHSGSPQ